MRNIIITISREYGSGGRFIGQNVSQKLDIPFYDRALIDLVSQKIGLEKDYIEAKEEELQNDNVFFNAFYKKHFTSPFAEKVTYSKLDKIYNAQSNIIKDISKNHPCIIVGRCADFILRENKNCMNIFIHANEESRIKRIIEEYDINREKALKKIEKTDQYRANYYRYYTSREWGEMKNYHLTIDSSFLKIDKAVEIIIKAIKLKTS